MSGETNCVYRDLGLCVRLLISRSDFIFYPSTSFKHSEFLLPGIRTQKYLPVLNCCPQTIHQYILVIKFTAPFTSLLISVMHNFNSVWSQTKRKSFLDWQGRSFYKLNFFVMLLWKLQKIKPTPFSLQNSAVLDVFYRYWIFEYRYSKNYKKKSGIAIMDQIVFIWTQVYLQYLCRYYYNLTVFSQSANCIFLTPNLLQLISSNVFCLRTLM